MFDTETTPDYSARDSTIAVNSYTTVRGRSTVPEEQFRAYWRDVHGPLCSRVPALGWYVQHHFASRRDAHLWPLAEGVTGIPDYELDGAVEIGWMSVADQQEFQRASSILFSDEQNVFDETVAYALPEGSTTIVDRDGDAAPNGADRFDRMHVHFTPREGQGAALLSLLATELGRIAEHSPEVVKVRVYQPQPHDNSTPNPPAPDVLHTVGSERVELVILEIAFVDPLARRRFFASDAFQETLPNQARLVEHLTAFPVSGVFTFVRDRELTTAGVRGNRVAELISDLAALNQVQPDVIRLMRTGVV